MSGADPMGIIPTNDVPATAEVIAAIASIELQRRETAKESGPAVSCRSALSKLNELLEHEKEALRMHGPDTGHPGNVEAVTIEIERVKGLSVTTSQRPILRSAFPGQRKVSWQNAQRNPARNKGRRTMGRAGGR